ncbi:MAG: SemiSWEET transporter [Nitrospinae bacterium]|nr:SemiSWEET transporter [Nitrospinota bacterium]
MSSTAILGYCAGFLTSLAFVAQVVKTWKTKSAQDLSLWMFSFFNVGVACWLVYGFLLKEWPIIFWNAITLLLGMAILIMKLKYK